MDYDIESKFDTVHEQNGEIRINCPECSDSGYHLYINLSRNVYHCFKCDAKGRFSIFAKKHQIPYTADTHKTFRYLSVDEAFKAHIPKEVLPLNINEFIPIPVSGSCYTNPFYTYLRDRGFTVSDIIRYRLHCALSGRYQLRIIIPCFHNTELVYFTARTIARDPTIKRYLNPPKSITKYARSETVFNIDSIQANADTCIIMEGALNAIIAGTSAVATFGKLVTDTQLLMLVHKRCKSYTVALDSDAIKESLTVARRLANFGCCVKIAEFPKNEDATDIGRERTAEVLRRAAPYNTYMGLTNLINSAS